MSESIDPEDKKIRIILISAACAAVTAFLAVVLVITIMISENFNILEWME